MESRLIHVFGGHFDRWKIPLKLDATYQHHANGRIEIETFLGDKAEDSKNQ